MRNRLDPELYDADLEWLVQGYDRDMGRSGTLSSTVAALEHGGPGVSGAEVVDAMIARLKRSVPAVARARRVFPRWRLLTEKHRCIHLVHYGTCGQLPARADALLGPFAKVALYQAQTQPNAWRRLLRALARGDGGFVAPLRNAAERVVRQAHRAWSRTLCEGCGEVSAGEVVIAGRRRSLCAECKAELREKGSDDEATTELQTVCLRR